MFTSYTVYRCNSNFNFNYSLSRKVITNILIYMTIQNIMVVNCVYKFPINLLFFYEFLYR